MEAFENRLPPWLRPEHDALVARLRHLEWTEVRPELRERCWDQFRDRLASGTAPEPRRTAGTTERYAFTRREAGAGSRPVADSRARIARSASARSAISLA